VGFSFVGYPQPHNVIYPGTDHLTTDRRIPWNFVHETHHILYAIYGESGYPLAHANLPLIYADKAGEHYSYIAEILRGFDNWLELGERWGTIKTFDDFNANGLPDNDPSLPDDDVRLGTEWNSEQYVRGIYQGFQQPYPNVAENIPYFTPVIDGRIDSGWRPLSEDEAYDELSIESRIYSSWDENYLYIAGSVDRAAYIDIWIDGDGDGWWHGRNNMHITYVIPSQNVTIARAMDASDAAREYQCTIQEPEPYSEVFPDGRCSVIWDDDPAYPFDRIIRPDDITAATQIAETGEYQIEIRIPVERLYEGQEVGYRIDIRSGILVANVLKEAYEFHHFPLSR
jgi:hypothetical protein